MGSITGSPFIGDHVAAFNEVPIFWTTTQAGYNDKDRTKRYMRNGERVVEKLPQSGHVGDYNDKRRAHGTRYVRMVDGAGNECAIVLTNGAAHMDPNTGYGQNVKSKARALGWFAIGECPSALIAAGEINHEAFLVKGIRESKSAPCMKGSFKGDHLDAMCPHATAERDARLAVNFKRENERAEKLKGHDTRLLEQQGEIIKQLAAVANGKVAELTASRARGKKDEE